jgi:hypothetical protein
LILIVAAEAATHKSSPLSNIFKAPKQHKSEMKSSHKHAFWVAASAATFKRMKN